MDKKKTVNKFLVFVIFILIVWVYRHWGELTNYKNSFNKLDKSVEHRALTYENQELEKVFEENHKNNSNYKFDINEANKKAETDISKALQDETKSVMVLAATSTNDSYKWLKKYDVIKAYSVFNFNGSIELDINELGDEFKANKTVILVGPETAKEEPVKCDYSIEGDIVKVDYEITEPMNSYLITVANKKAIAVNASAVASSIKNNINEAFNNSFYLPDVDNGNFLVRNYLLLRLIKVKPLMILVSSGNEDIDKELKQYCLESTIDFVEADLKMGGMTLTEKDIKVVSKSEFYLRYKLLKLLYPKDEEIPYVDGVYRSNSFPAKYAWFYWVGYYTYSDLEDTINRTKARKNKNYSIFSKEDIFCFNNFNTEASYGGNCAGIAYYTMKLFNDGKVKEQGSSDFDSWSRYKTDCLGGKKGVVDWDISKDENNKELLTRHIYDYNSGFTADHTHEYKVTHANGEVENLRLTEYYLSPYEKEFSNMIGSYWFEINKLKSEKDYRKDYGDYWDYGLIQDALDCIDDNKIVQINFTFDYADKDGADNSGGHAVNAYHYEVIDDNNIDLYIYDCNFPVGSYSHVLSERDFSSWKSTYEYDLEHNSFEIHDLFDGFSIMHIKKKNIGDREVFTFEYAVTPSGSVVATNNQSNSDGSYLFLINDEDMNFFNDKYY